MPKLLEYSTDYYLREPYPRKLFVFVFGYQFNFYGRTAQQLHRLLKRYA